MERLQREPPDATSRSLKKDLNANIVFVCTLSLYYTHPGGTGGPGVSLWDQRYQRNNQIHGLALWDV